MTSSELQVDIQIIGEATRNIAKGYPGSGKPENMPLAIKGLVDLSPFAKSPTAGKIYSSFAQEIAGNERVARKFGPELIHYCAQAQDAGSIVNLKNAVKTFSLLGLDSHNNYWREYAAFVTIAEKMALDEDFARLEGRQPEAQATALMPKPPEILSFRNPDLDPKQFLESTRRFLKEAKTDNPRVGMSPANFANYLVDILKPGGSFVVDKSEMSIYPDGNSVLELESTINGPFGIKLAFYLKVVNAPAGEKGIAVLDKSIRVLKNAGGYKKDLEDKMGKAGEVNRILFGRTNKGIGKDWEVDNFQISDAGRVVLSFKKKGAQTLAVTAPPAAEAEAKTSELTDDQKETLDIVLRYSEQKGISEMSDQASEAFLEGLRSIAADLPTESLMQLPSYLLTELAAKKHLKPEQISALPDNIQRDIEILQDLDVPVFLRRTRRTL